MSSPEYQVLMSPLLSKRLQDIEDELKHTSEQLKLVQASLHQVSESVLQLSSIIGLQMNSLETKLGEIQTHVQTQIQTQKHHSHITQLNHHLLQDNRKIYMNALQKIQETEEKELKPMLSKICEETPATPAFEARIFNRLWRTNRLTHNGNLTFPIMTAGRIHLPKEEGDK